MLRTRKASWSAPPASAGTRCSTRQACRRCACSTTVRAGPTPCGPYKDPLNYNNAQPTSRCPNSRVCLYTYTPDVDWGQGWHAKTYEITRLKDASSNRRWAVMDRSSQRGYLLVPGAGDGAADAFSSADLWVLRYQPTEDRNGLQGNAAGDGLGAYLNHEDVGGQDVVVWYCGHLSHHAHDGGDHWHAVGPDLIPFGSW
jgi:hypothetical protein